MFLPACMSVSAKPEERDRTPRTGATDIVSHPVGAENQAWVLEKSRIQCLLCVDFYTCLSHLEEMCILAF